jgi:hypothetical protein
MVMLTPAQRGRALMPVWRQVWQASVWAETAEARARAAMGASAANFIVILGYKMKAVMLKCVEKSWDEMGE